MGHSSSSDLVRPFVMSTSWFPPDTQPSHLLMLCLRSLCSPLYAPSGSVRSHAPQIIIAMRSFGYGRNDGPKNDGPKKPLATCGVACSSLPPFFPGRVPEKSSAFSLLAKPAKVEHVGRGRHAQKQGDVAPPAPPENRENQRRADSCVAALVAYSACS